MSQRTFSIIKPDAVKKGYAAAIISGGEGTAASKMPAMEAAGITVVKSPADIGSASSANKFSRNQTETGRSKST